MTLIHSQHRHPFPRREHGCAWSGCGPFELLSDERRKVYESHLSAAHILEQGNPAGIGEGNVGKVEA